MTPDGGHCSDDEWPSAFAEVHHMLGMEVPQILQ